MRILRIHSWDGGVAGGAEAVIREASERLRAKGHEETLVAITSKPSDFFGKDAINITVPEMGVKRYVGDIIGTPRVEEALESALKEFKPDIVHLHHFDAAFASIGRVLKASQVPLVFTAHDAELVCPISTLVLPNGRVCEGGVLPRCGLTGCKVGYGLPYNLWQARQFEDQLVPKVKAYFCSSVPLARYLHDNGFRPAVHLPAFATIPQSVADGSDLGHEGNAPRLGFMGRLEENKGVEDLLQAVSAIHASKREIYLDLAGDGKLADQFKDLANDLGISDITTWSGWVSGSAKEAWFRRQRLLVMPSRPFEIFGLVALEALVREVPVVATDAGGVSDIVRDGITGRLVPHSNPEAIMKGVVELLDNDALARRLASEGRKMVLNEFTPQLHVERLLAAYNKILRGEPLPSTG